MKSSERHSIKEILYPKTKRFQYACFLEWLWPCKIPKMYIV